ncbi:hypothetical protein V6N13_104936 [Hibiscus sabdariffa]
MIAKSNITIDDDIDFLDDDVALVRAFVVESHGLDVKYDVCVADVVGLRLVDDQLVWGFVQSDHNQTESIVEDVWANVVAKMRLVDEQSVWGYVKLEPNQKPYILEDHNMKSVYFLLHQL